MARIKTENREQVTHQTRQTLLDTAAEEFARQGYDQANINTISTKAGFAKGTIYNYFPSKKGLLLAVIDSIAQEHLAYLESSVLEVDDPARRLECFFKAGFEYVAQYSLRARLMFNTVNGANQEQKEYCFRAYQPMFRLVAEQILSPGMRQGIFSQAELEPTTILVMTIYLGTASQVDKQGRPWLDPAQVAQFTLNGLQSEKEEMR
jgi:AcrR family transcriptional regulator